MQSWLFANMFLQIENQDGGCRVVLREWCSRNLTTASISKILLSELPVFFFARGFSFKVSVKENKVPTEKNYSRASIFAPKSSYISN